MKKMENSKQEAPNISTDDSYDPHTEVNDKAHEAAARALERSESSGPGEPPIRKGKLKYDSVRPPHGKWSPEPERKHKKGGETIRKPDGLLKRVENKRLCYTARDAIKRRS